MLIEIDFIIFWLEKKYLHSEIYFITKTMSKEKLSLINICTFVI